MQTTLISLFVLSLLLLGLAAANIPATPAPGALQVQVAAAR